MNGGIENGKPNLVKLYRFWNSRYRTGNNQNRTFLPPEDDEKLMVYSYWEPSTWPTPLPLHSLSAGHS